MNQRRDTQQRQPNYEKEDYAQKTQSPRASSQSRKKQRASGKLPASRRAMRRRRKRIIRKLQLYGMLLATALVVVGIVFLLIRVIGALFGSQEVQLSANDTKVEVKGEISEMSLPAPKMDVDLLTVNPYSRPGKKMKKVNGIVVHYVGNAGTTAAQNRNYFEGLKDKKTESASSHFVVGIDGEIVQCIPTTEIAYCSNERNDDTIAIECCHPKKDGKFTEGTYESLVQLTAFLCCKYDLEVESVIRHYDVTGKLCPKYYVTHEEQWIEFKKDVAHYIEENQE